MSEHDKEFPGLSYAQIAPSFCDESPGASTTPARRRTGCLTVVVCILAVMLSTTTPVLAEGTADPTSVVVDVLVARPVSLVMTIAGTALFVVTLPIAAISRSVPTTTHTLVAGPANDLFTRPVGDLDDWLCY